jgi:hypothetical protein
MDMEMRVCKAMKIVGKITGNQNGERLWDMRNKGWRLGGSKVPPDETRPGLASHELPRLPAPRAVVR